MWYIALQNCEAQLPLFFFFFFPAQSLSEKAVTEVGIRRKPEAKRKGGENFNVVGRAGHKEFMTEGSER